MPRGASPKREREYNELKEKFQEEGGYTKKSTWAVEPSRKRTSGARRRARLCGALYPVLGGTGSPSVAPLSELPLSSASTAHLPYFVSNRA